MTKDKDMAKHIVRVTQRIFSELEDLRSFLEVHSDPSTYKEYQKTIAAAVETIDGEILGRVFSKHPELKKEKDNKISKYGEWVG